MRAIDLLKKLIATPSSSRQEEATAAIIYDHLVANGAEPHLCRNNVWALSKNFDPNKPTLMLNSHHDTVKPASSYSRDPFLPTIEDGKLYGLGSNDAGASVVSLIETFLSLQASQFPFNLLLAISAEEEVGGENGIRALLPHLAQMGISPACAIVGEPTGMQGAIAERGLVVLDCVTKGVAGHAARKEGVNAIYKAMEDITTLINFKFDKQSEILGPISINVTQINAGTQHNAIPDLCTWVVDLRTTDAYTNQETVDILQNAISNSILTPRSTRVQASVILPDHPLVQAASGLGISTFVSPTTSDMSLMHTIPSIKIGPGDSARSHKADEYIYIEEVESALPIYAALINNLNL